MQKWPLVLALVTCVIVATADGARADDCPSGQHYRMSGACADANGKKATTQKPGNIQFRNAQGQMVTIKHATSYAGCVRNGHSLGYAQPQIEAYCHEHYAQGLGTLCVLGHREPMMRGGMYPSSIYIVDPAKSCARDHARSERSGGFDRRAASLTTSFETSRFCGGAGSVCDAVDGSSTWHLSAKESGAVGMSSMWPRERVEGDGRVGDCGRSAFNIDTQPWTLLVTGLMLIWFVYVGAPDRIMKVADVAWWPVATVRDARRDVGNRGTSRLKVTSPKRRDGRNCEINGAVAAVETLMLFWRGGGEGPYLYRHNRRTE